jgi:hypothetical protein
MMTLSGTKILRNAHGKAVSVVPGKKEKAMRYAPPHTTAMRMDLTEPTHFTIHMTDTEGICRMSHIRKGKEEDVFPHYGAVEEGNRLVTGPFPAGGSPSADRLRERSKPNRRFRLTKLSSGGFYLSSDVDPTLYVGISDDGYLILVKAPYPWFLT